MVHSAVQQPMEAYITYDIDFVPKAKGDDARHQAGVPAVARRAPVGLPGLQRPAARSAARTASARGRRSSAPAFNSWGETEVGQGEPGNGKGEDWEFPAEGEPFGTASNFTGGTIIGIGGHLHPGGLQNEIDLVRGGRRKRIYTGKAATGTNDKKKGGGPPDSWDFSMRGHRDSRSGASTWSPATCCARTSTYDTTLQSTYENMGIAVSLLVPDDENGKPQAPGVEPVQGSTVDNCDRLRARAASRRRRRPSATQGCRDARAPHENDNRGGAGREVGAPTSAGADRPRSAIADFLYVPGDLSTTDIDRHPDGARSGETLRFTNFEGGAIWHTITSCKFPCLGPTGAAFPLADGETSQARKSTSTPSELGFGVPEIGPAKNKLNWSIAVTKEEGYKPGEVVTYFCRIHPFMRGAFEVAE